MCVSECSMCIWLECMCANLICYMLLPTAGWKKCVRGGAIGLTLATAYVLFTSKDRIKSLLDKWIVLRDSIIIIIHYHSQTDQFYQGTIEPSCQCHLCWRLYSNPMSSLNLLSKSCNLMMLKVNIKVTHNCIYLAQILVIFFFQLWNINETFW